MSRADIEAYFAQVPVWMKNDIRREIRLAHATRDREDLMRELDLLGGGNLLAALGLVTYSEALGRLRTWNRGFGYGRTPDECFLAFFDQMEDGRYRAFRLSWEASHPTTLYEALRCGLIHEYQPKVNSAVWIGADADFGLADEDGFLIFRVEPYFRHFCAEVDQLYAELLALPDPQVPPPLVKSKTGTNTAAPLVERSS